MTDITTEVHDNSESIGTLEHLDPALLEIGLSDRVCQMSAIRRGQYVENAFATRRG